MRFEKLRYPVTGRFEVGQNIENIQDGDNNFYAYK